MITQSDIERERYEARRKGQLDFNTGMKAAEEAGLAKGERIGVIHLCERLLQRDETPTEQLKLLSMEELARLSDELHNQVMNRT